MDCDMCGADAVGEIEFDDGELVVGCADCLLEIIADPKKPVEAIVEYTEEEKR
jgi:hypothetical protein